MAAKKKTAKKEINLSSLVGEKLKDVGNDDGFAVLHFSNNLQLKVKGDIVILVKANRVIDEKEK